MNEDRIWEMYYSDVFQPETVRACRARLHWLVAGARGRVLDVGCSQGVLPILLAREGHGVVGVDIEQAAVEFARDKVSGESPNVQARITLEVGDLFDWPIPGQFDTVIMGEVLEHVAHPERMIVRARQALAEGGRLLLTVPLGWLEHHDHKQAFMPSDLIRLLEPAFGIEELEIADAKIRIVAVAGAASDAAVIEPTRLLVEVERAMVAYQYAAVDASKMEARQRARLNERIETLEKQRAVFAEMKDKKIRLEKRCDELRDRTQVLRARIDELTSQRNRIKESGSYQLGSLLVGVGLRPQEVVHLPARLASLSLRELKKRGKAVETLQRAVDFISPDPKPDTTQVYSGSYRVDVPTARAITDGVPRRVLHLLEYSLPHQQNGYTLRSFHVVRSQKHHGWDPVVVTKPGFPRAGANGEPEQVADVPHYRLPGRELNGEFGLADFTRAYVTEAAPVVERVRPSLIQAGSNFRNAYAAMELARNFRLPFVYEVRGLWEETRVANGSLQRDERQYEQLVGVETYCMRAADAIVTLNEALKAELVRRGVVAEKIFLVPNAVDVDTATVVSAPAGLRQSLGLSGRFIVSYIGSVSRLESLHLLVEAMQILRRTRNDIGALIVGSGAELDNLRDLADQLGVGDSVRFAGSVPHTEIANYYALSDAVVCARGADRVCELVTPLKPYEAMAYRKPVIVSDIPALREMVEDGQTGRIFTAESAKALARAIAELADDPSLCAAIAERAYEWVKDNRSWLRVTEGYEPAYDYARSAFSRRVRS